jgi:hypothetical protein
MFAPSLQLQYCISRSTCAINVIGGFVSPDYVVVAIVTIVVLAATFIL